MRIVYLLEATGKRNEMDRAGAVSFYRTENMRPGKGN